MVSVKNESVFTILMEELDVLVSVLSNEYVDFEVANRMYPLKVSLEKAGREYLVNGRFRNNDSFRGIIVHDGKPKMFFWTDTYPEYLKGVCEAKDGYVEGKAVETDRVEDYLNAKINGIQETLTKAEKKIKVTIKPASKKYDF